MGLDVTMQQRLAAMKRELLETVGRDINDIRLESVREQAAMLIVLRAMMAEMSAEQRASIADRATEATQIHSTALQEKVAETLKHLRIG